MLIEGQHGGIVKMPEGCKPDAQAMGRGITPYYSVKNLEEVSLRFLPTNFDYMLIRRRQKSALLNSAGRRALKSRRKGRMGIS
jgi:hypothetical protein